MVRKGPGVVRISVLNWRLYQTWGDGGQPFDNLRMKMGMGMGEVGDLRSMGGGRRSAINGFGFGVELLESGWNWGASMKRALFNNR